MRFSGRIEVIYFCQKIEPSQKVISGHDEQRPIRLKSLYLVTKATAAIGIRPETKKTYVDGAWSEYRITIVIRY